MTLPKEYICVNCSKSYTRKEKLDNHYELKKVKGTNGRLIPNKCFKSKTRNYGATKNEVILLSSQQSIFSFQKKKDDLSNATNPSIETISPKKDSSYKCSSTSDDEDIASQINALKISSSQINHKEPLEHLKTPCESLQPASNSLPKETFNSQGEDIPATEIERYNELLKYQKTTIALLEAGISQ